VTKPFDPGELLSALARWIPADKPAVEGAAPAAVDAEDMGRQS
jgi:hypothetical protein